MFAVGALEFGVIPGRKLSLTFGLILTADKSREGQCKNEIIFEIPWSHPGRRVEVKCPSASSFYLIICFKLQGV